MSHHSSPWPIGSRPKPPGPAASHLAAVAIMGPLCVAVTILINAQAIAYAPEIRIACTAIRAVVARVFVPAFRFVRFIVACFYYTEAVVAPPLPLHGPALCEHLGGYSWKGTNRYYLRRSCRVRAFDFLDRSGASVGSSGSDFTFD